MKSDNFGTGEGTQQLRVRAILASWFAVLAVVAVIAVLAGGWATYTAHADPGTVESTATETAWAVDGSFDHSATVTRPNPVFQTGATLENRSTYFLAASPILDGDFTAQYRPTGDEPAAVQLDADLVHRAADEETVFWSDRTDLAATEAQSVAAGETESLEFSVNASRAMERRENITAALGSTPGELSTVIVVDVTATAPANGEPAELTYSAELPVTLADGTYSIGSPDGASEQVTDTTTETVPRAYGPAMSYGGPLVLLLGLVGLGGLAAVRFRDEPIALTPEERALLDYRDQRAEFDEWVVRAELPDSVLDREASAAASFADLVDFAIDANVAVIEEPNRERYYAVTPDLLVTYDPPEPLEEG
ncbi:putative membrane protein [Halanaeroarchaeum sp. HSR-CO]|uniref:DUF5305 domain-containing protein n=1 Tax=Halanaeroarchaeum sp. HSR-CO TaxID=2866382 RepID=UPI00217CEB15|nr:DUF5305 domain-containing protein [Halanaeroarchaeum sp. HSR-CO]UWG46453.1 putative membrane protein [Halanaeroarchaeum sp. HSR-CO]